MQLYNLSENVVSDVDELPVVRFVLEPSAASTHSNGFVQRTCFQTTLNIHKIRG